MGLGRAEVSSLIRVPNPPAKITAFMNLSGISFYGNNFISFRASTYYVARRIATFNTIHSPD
jgi:hypothetical protein